MNPHLRRLISDYEMIKDEFIGHSYIIVEPTQGNPPCAYRITYKVVGITRLDDQKDPIYAEQHVASIYLQSSYPSDKPRCVLETPIWHPNFGAYICIGDLWGAGETLKDIIVQIGDMIQYKSYNPKNPLNGAAAMWTRQNEHLFPVGNLDLYQGQPDVDLVERDFEITFH